MLRDILAFVAERRTYVPFGAGALAATAVGLACGVSTGATLGSVIAAVLAFLTGCIAIAIVDDIGIRRGWW